jgi:hypothetical protein
MILEDFTKSFLKASNAIWSAARSFSGGGESFSEGISYNILIKNI